MLHNWFNAVLFAGIFIFGAKRLMRYLQFFQQEEYNNARFWHWLLDNRAYDRRGTAIAAFAWFIAGCLGSASVAALSAAAALIVVGFNEEDPRTSGKITLKMTARATRIFRVAAVLLLLVVAIWLQLGTHVPSLLFWFGVILLLQIPPFLLMAAKRLLQPDEDARQAAFLKEAKDKLAAIHPLVIGITGSYGKTTTKAFLGKLLEVSLGPTFWPPKSVNTPMGITRELRESLKPGQKYAVIEMGAYQRGSIQRLCELTPPRAAIVTAVGLMHLERMGSEENIFQAKSELARALPADGLLVCNGDNAGSRRIAEENPKAVTLLYGLESEKGKLDAVLDSVRTTADGTNFRIQWKGSQYEGWTRLHGRPALSNILASFTMACALGADPQYVVAAIRNLEPFDNRLEVRHVGDGLQINDAYNSNPDGFQAALEVLKDLPGEKKILMTPGMIELGDRQASENRRIAELAAKVCDCVIVVGDTNREALRAGLKAGGLAEESVILVPNRQQAFEKLGALRGPKDVVLIENDLPDLFEIKITF
jgi:UDP-N-acetylmuramoyl-tripeptide--D-alanyl-D-alanine ligase